MSDGRSPDAAGTGVQEPATPLEQAISTGVVQPVQSDVAWGERSPASLRCHELGFSTDGERILQPTSFFIRPGTLMAVMGPSGSGKSTLLDCIRGVKRTGQLTGQVFVNGVEDDGSGMRRLSVYLRQKDALDPSMTVVEVLAFSAALRLAWEGRTRQREIVDHSLDCTLLSHQRDQEVGKLSGGQKRRLSLAADLLARPSILLLDEPTTGLDSAAAAIIVRLLMRYCHRKGAVAVCIIHQPQKPIFDSFDRVLLLGRGRTAFWGGPDQLASFAARCGYPVPHGQEPQDFVMDVLTGIYQLSTNDGIRDEGELGRLQDAAADAATARMASCLQVDPGTAEAGEEPSAPVVPASASFARQVSELNVRWFRRTWRDRNYWVSKWVQTFIICALIAAVFAEFSRDDQPAFDLNILTCFGYVFTVATIIMDTTSIAAVDDAIRFEMEFERSMYSATAFSSAKVVSLLVPMFIQSLCSITCGYLLLDLPGSIEAFSKTVMSLLCMLFCGQAVINAAAFQIHKPDDVIAIFVVFVILNFIASGVYVPQYDLPEWWRWTYHIFPMQYATSAFSVEHMSEIGLQVLRQDPARHNYLGLLCCTGTLLLLFGASVSITSRRLFGRAKRRTRPAVPTASVSVPATANSATAAVDTIADTGAPSDASAVTEVITGTTGAEGGSPPSAWPPAGPSVLPGGPTVSVHDLACEAPSKQGFPKTLLVPTTCHFTPGSLTAILGPSGCGKSTFLDCIYGVKAGCTVYGAVLLDGKRVQPRTLWELAAYIRQDDTIEPSATVGEVMGMHALLRLPKTALNDREARITAALRDMLLEEARCRPVSKLSGGQLRRLSVAMDLIARPRVVLLDEPTTGLDSAAAEVVIARLQKYCKDTGCIVMCTIHQPQKLIWDMFDNVMLLAHGVLTYKGPAQQLEPFLSAACKMSRPPATSVSNWALELLTNTPARTKVNDEHPGANALHGMKSDEVAQFLGKWHASSQRGVSEGVVCERLLARSAPATQLTRPVQATIVAQFIELNRRWALRTLRDPDPWPILLIQSLVFGALLSGLLAHSGRSEELSSRFMYGFFSLIATLGTVTLDCTVPLAARDRALYMVERERQMYALVVFFFGKAASLLIPMAVHTGLLFIVGFFVMDIQRTLGGFLLSWLALGLLTLTFTVVAFVAGLYSKSQADAVAMFTLVASLNMIFGGVMARVADLPDWCSWASYVMPMRYAIAVLVHANLPRMEAATILGEDGGAALPLVLLAALLLATLIAGLLVLFAWQKAGRQIPGHTEAAVMRCIVEQSTQGTLVVADLEGTITELEACHEVWLFIQGLPCCQRTLRSALFVAMLPVWLLVQLIASEESSTRLVALLLWRLPAAVGPASRRVAAAIRGGARGGVMAEIGAMRSAGAHVVLVTGMLEPGLRAFAAEEGHALLATDCEVRDGRFTGLLRGKPNVGLEKSRRLLEWLNEKVGPEWKSQYALIGYGNSFNDLSYLSMCDRAVVVAPPYRLREEANRKGWRIFGQPSDAHSASRRNIISL